MNRLQRSSINIISSAVGWAVPLLINFGATPFLLHALGEAAYGLQNLVVVVIGYLAIMDMGLDIPVTKFLAEDHARGDAESENRLLSTTLQLYGVIGLVGMMIIMVAAGFLARRVFVIPDELIGQAITVFFLAGVGFSVNVMIRWGYATASGLQRYDISNAVSLVTSLAGVGIGLAAVYAGYGVVGYVLIKVIASSLAGLSYFLIIRRLLPNFRLRWGLDRPMLRRVGGYIGYGIVLRVSGILGSGLAQTLIGAWLGVAAVVSYAVPSLVAISSGQLIGKMLHFIFPMASELYGTGRLEALQDIFIRATRFVVALATAAIIPLLMLGDSFLTLWIGPSMAAQASTVLRLLLLAYYVQTLAVMLANNVVVGTGHIRVFAVYTLVRGLMVGTGCILLIRPLGIEGAGLALLIAGVADVIFLMVTLRRYLHISFCMILRVAYLRPILLGVVIGGLAFLARPLATSWLGLGALLGLLALFYVLVGYWIGVFGETERRAVIGLWQIVTRSA